MINLQPQPVEDNRQPITQPYIRKGGSYGGEDGVSYCQCQENIFLGTLYIHVQQNPFFRRKELFLKDVKVLIHQ
jgi:hypothetical protein